MITDIEITTNTERPIETRQSKRISIAFTIKKLAVLQVWFGILALCFCFALTQTIDITFWFRWSQIDITLCVIIIFTGCIGISAGVYQTSVILNGTFMSFNTLCCILSIGVLLKCSMGLSYATSNWRFLRKTDAILYLCLITAFFVEAVYSLAITIYWLCSVRILSALPIQDVRRSIPQLPMFLSQNGQMMVMPTLGRQPTDIEIHRNSSTSHEMHHGQRTSNRHLDQPTLRSEPPPAYTEENFTWM